jgi:transcription antitermination protein NusB
MANRRLSRSIVLQVLFEWDSGDMNATTDQLTARLREHGTEFGAGDDDIPFMQSILNNVVAKRKELDAIIEKAAPEWPIGKIALIDRNVLRIGLAELLYADRTQVPAKVAINEAIELAKTFGSETSGRFVNGVLGAVYIELGEPGKDEISPRKKKDDTSAKHAHNAHADHNGPIHTEELVGMVIYAHSDDTHDVHGIYLALVHDIFGHWTLAKGKLLPGEELEIGVKRKALEELGLEVAIEEQLGENEYVARDPENGKKRRHCRYLLARAPFADLKLKREGGLDDASWFPLSKVGDLNFYDDVLPVITKAITVLVGKN